jgi:hypothetical protein
MNAERLLLAEEFLREVVYRSREEQSALHSLRNSLAPEAKTCGLGGRAAIALDLSPRGRELFDRVFDRVSGSPEWEEEIRRTMTAWIERQDAIDRKRNHFLKAFRGRHGFDRTRYEPGVVSELEAGLAGINAEENSERRATAERLIALER